MEPYKGYIFLSLLLRKNDKGRTKDHTSKNKKDFIIDILSPDFKKFASFKLPLNDDDTKHAKDIFLENGKLLVKYISPENGPFLKIFKVNLNID